MIEELKKSVGFRDSMRLFAAADIVRIFSPFSEFSRSEIVRELADVYSTKCLDRAIADMESASVLAVKQVMKNDISAGASYTIQPAARWGTREASKLRARMNRHGRGGCRLVAS